MAELMSWSHIQPGENERLKVSVSGLKKALNLFLLLLQAFLTKGVFSSSLSLKCALRESGCRIGYEPTKNELRSLSAVDIQGDQRGGSALFPLSGVLCADGYQVFSPRLHGNLARALWSDPPPVTNLF